MSRLRQFLFILLLLACPVWARAQQFSYVYLQGDKETPFYVKLDGAMQPRYGKNYCILPQLEAGTVRLEILFQQNAYPAQQFTIQVPEAGSRAFMLTRRNGAFSLYDLQQQFYLNTGNAAEDDHLPQAETGRPTAIAASNEPGERIPEEPAVAPKAQEPKPVRRPREKKAAATSVRPERAGPANPAGKEKAAPEFLDITLANNHEQPAPDTDIAADTVLTRQKPLAATFRNSDCPQPLADKDFERIYKAMMEQSADEDRVSYLNNQMDNCYQSWQVRTLGTMLSEDAARYTFLKNIYPHVTDQQAFPLLDDMLRSEVWKAQFYQLTHH